VATASAHALPATNARSLARWSSALGTMGRARRDDAGPVPAQAHAIARADAGAADASSAHTARPADTQTTKPLDDAQSEHVAQLRVPAQQMRTTEASDPLPPLPVTPSLSLRELSLRHASHRQTPIDRGWDVAHAEALERDRQERTAAAVDAPPSFPAPGASGANAADPTALTRDSAGATDQLQSLIESCCSRMWVSDGADRAGAPRGVMLDLGSWMPGCTLEVARAAGTLRIMLRGVHDERRAGLERELEGLSAGLAESLGCQVVTAVESRGAMR
jgi:hypothetical protein